MNILTLIQRGRRRLTLLRSEPSSVRFGASVTFVLAVFLCSFILQVRKNPLRLDEVDYFQCMENVVKLGLPIYYAGEVSVDYSRLMYLSTRHLGSKDFEFYRYKPETGILKETFFALVDGNSRYTYGMWHPPLYIYLGSLFLRVVPLAPDNSHLLRYFNLIFGVGVFAGMMALSWELYPRRYRQVFLIALTLYTLNSLAVRGATLIDYNATLGPCVAIWFILTYLRSERSRRFHWGLAVLTMLAFCTGLGIAASLLLGISAYIFMLGRYRKPWCAIASIIAGTVSFFLMFLIFCRAFDLPFSQPFLHNISRVGAQSGLLSWIQRIHMVLTFGEFHSKEIGVVTVMISVVLFLKTVSTGQVRRVPARSLLPIVIAVGFISQASLGAVAYWFAKYIVFLLPPLFVYLSGEGLALVYTPSRLWRSFAAIALVTIALTSGINSLQMTRQPGGTLYNKGEQGIVSISEMLRAISDPDEVILSTKDIGFFANREFVQWSGAYLTDVVLLRTRIEEEKVRYIVASSGMLDAVPGSLATYLDQEFHVQGASGSFVILKKNGS